MYTNRKGNALMKIISTCDRNLRVYFVADVSVLIERKDLD